MPELTTDPFAAADGSAAALAQRTGQSRHDIAVVLGSGWAPAADALGTATAEVPLDELGGFPAPAVAGHVAAVRSVLAGQRRVLVFLGRVHLYEGHSPAAVVHGVRTAIAVAAAAPWSLTNASSAASAPACGREQPVLISDHLNLTATSPLAGLPPGGPDGRPLFTDLTDVYSGPAASRGASAAARTRRGRVRRPDRPAVRDARRDQDAQVHGRRPGRHVDGAGGHRRPPSRRRGARPVGRHQRRRRSCPSRSSTHQDVLATGRRGSGRMSAWRACSAYDSWRR